MFFALDNTGKKVKPTISGQIGTCEICGAKVVGYCGELISWHWKHSVEADCDPWSEAITEWHIEWQKYLEEKGAEIEVVINRYGEKHRADAVMPNGLIIELQHSSISVQEIAERENFYGAKMLWVFDTIDAYESDRFSLRKKVGKKHTFRWKHPRKSAAYTKRQTFLDLGEGSLFQLSKMYPDAPCGGIGEYQVSLDLMDYHGLLES